MQYKKINLMLPTYGRSDTMLPRFIASAISKVSDPENICFTFCVNKSDKNTIDFIKDRLRGGEVDYHIIYEELPRPHLAKYFNKMYKETRFKHASTIISMLGDDMEFLTDGYDLLILKAVNDCDGLGLIFGDDCYSWHEKLCVNLFTSRRFVDMLKPLPFMCEFYSRDQIDIVWRDVTMQMGLYIYVSSLKIKHHHCTRPDVGKDATYIRLEKEDESVQANEHLRDEYIQKCIQNIRKNAAKTMKFGVDVIMTTYERTELLKETVASYCSVPIQPQTIHVFDDKSSNSEEIRKICDSLPGMVWHENKANYGCHKATPHALRYMFEENKSEAVIILDSDIQLDAMWWLKINRLYDKLKGDKNFGSINMLNLPNNPKGTPAKRHRNLLTKPHWGACGALITKDFWEKFVVPNEQVPNGVWDNKCSHAATIARKINYVTTPSLIQHTGITKGTHLGAGSYALDFRNARWYNKDIAVDPDGNEKQVLFSVHGRYGDIIMSSMIVNMLIEKGYNVTFLTIPYYSDLVGAILPDVKRLTEFNHCIEKFASWGDMPTEKLREKFDGRGYRYYINAQPGSTENHDTLLQTGMHMAAYIKSRVETIIDEPLPNNFIDYLPKIDHIPPVVAEGADHDRPLAVIAPEVISCNTAISPELLKKLYNELSEGYCVKILTQHRPDLPFSEIRGKYLYNLSFLECLQLLKTVDMFIGNDSGLAWASMFNRKAHKVIYHNVGRLLQTNVWYNFIDPFAKDKVVSDE